MLISRFDLDPWLDLFLRARQYFHPQHQVLCAIARFCLPEFGREKGKTVNELSLMDALTKADMAGAYLAVLEIVEAGISRNRAKVLYELAEIQLHILSLDKHDESSVSGE